MLGGTAIQDQDLKQLAGLKHLRCLVLAGTQVTDRGLKELAGFKSLKELDLKDTKVTDAGIAELRKRRPELAIERGEGN
jgi:internalin A